MNRLRNYLLTGLLVLGPTVVSLWVTWKVFNALDNMLGQYLRFQRFGAHRIPGLGLLAMLGLLALVGWLASLVGGRGLLPLWDRLLTRIPGLSLVYSSTKNLGEAFLTQRQSVFKKVVLVPYPHPGIYAVAFVTAPPGRGIPEKLGPDVECVFVPSTPNPTTGFFQIVPRRNVVYLDWTVEEGIRTVVSGGVAQPGGPAAPDAHPRPAAS
jgi:uncharacterized membrane protein